MAVTGIQRVALGEMALVYSDMARCPRSSACFQVTEAVADWFP